MMEKTIKTKWRFPDMLLFVAAFLAGLIVLSLALAFLISDHQHTVESRRLNVINNLENLRNGLERTIATALLAGHGMATMVEAKPDLKEVEFVAMAKALMGERTGIRNIALAFGTTITYVFPEQGNLMILGKDYKDIPTQRESVLRVIRTGRQEVDGPIKLIQCGTGVVVRVPAFVTGKDGVRRYWALVSVPVELDILLPKAKLRDSDIEIEIAVRNVEGGLIFGREEIFSSQEPVIMNINLPGVTWQINAVPVGGWKQWPRALQASGLLGLALSLLFGIFIYSILKSRQRTKMLNTELEDRVRTRTADLQLANEMLARAKADLESEHRLADIINLLPDATMVIDTQGRVLFWNQAMETMTGVPASEMVGKGDYEYALPFYGRRRPLLIDMVFKPDAFIPGAHPPIEARGDMIWAEADLKKPLLGRHVHLRASASLVRDAHGLVVGAIETIFDITERRELIEHLGRAKDEAERASKAKSLFIASMTHELRTPLNAIISFTEFVATETFGPVGHHQYIEHATYAGQSAHHLLDIVNSILDLSKIEAGVVHLERSLVSLPRTVNSCVSIVREIARTAGVTVKVAVPPAIPNLMADERALRQIIINLLSNSIKFNASGGSILITALEAGDFIEITVADTGAGIPSDSIARVMKPFEQIDNRYTRSSGGTGIGLSIVDGLVKLHGGTLSINSTVGKGTSITVRLPNC